MTPAAAAAPPVRLTAFAAMWFAYFATVGLFNPYAPLWFKELGFSTLAIGAIASMQSWTRVLGPYGWGWPGDHTRRRVELIRMAAERGKSARPKLKVGICGEHGGDPASIEFCHEVGLDYVSCSPFRVPIARLAAAHAAIGSSTSRDV